jgi:hypothetical protein
VEGLWTVEFGSNTGIFGSGVVVLRQGRIEGGDASYFYVGTYQKHVAAQAYPAAFHASITVKSFLPNAESVFKTFNREITLNLKGTLSDENNALAVGTPEGMPEMNLGIRMKRRT